MTKMQVPLSTPSSAISGRWTGWLVFASIMLCVVGAINLIQGLVALTRDQYFLVRAGDQLLITDFSTWGWVLIVWGAAQVAAGLGLNSGKGWARWLAIVIACISVLIQTLFLAAFPIWSVMIIAIDVIIVYALTAHWAEAREGL
jgi:uncharacterized membrane protein (DUF2068 family)